MNHIKETVEERISSMEGHMADLRNMMKRMLELQAQMAASEVKGPEAKNTNSEIRKEEEEVEIVKGGRRRPYVEPFHREERGEQHGERISSVPASIGNCSLLNEVDLSANILTELPETFGQLRNLKVLHLRLNNLKTLPSTLFKFCQKLSVLSFFGTQITNDYLRQAEGWQAFDRRRRGKYVKGVDPEAGPSRAFDKGDDSEKEQ
ncbi:LRR repeats and ubiquitin-like domain-containing protein [Dendrobium catenatum]|uniref:LRR repeats and ubiquitin-like domain-containing protein n=1 Tax=Dendrobium catenatum TaxID=906689 RepID=A0A2I0WBH0_9ASPA|nr:LRR repeats and ubiquitin-like domain-containing protein [Dendrobium catenatum]